MDRQELLTLCRNALRPFRMDIIHDTESADFIFVHHFEDYPPIVIRMTTEEVHAARHETFRLQGKQPPDPPLSKAPLGAFAILIGLGAARIVAGGVLTIFSAIVG